jgi:hypothetical protein
MAGRMYGMEHLAVSWRSGWGDRRSRQRAVGAGNFAVCEATSTGPVAEVKTSGAFLFDLEDLFLVHGREGAEEKVAGVGHDGGAARGDATLGLIKQEAGEVVDGDGGLKLGEAGGEKRVRKSMKGKELVGNEGRAVGRQKNSEDRAGGTEGFLSNTTKITTKV